MKYLIMKRDMEISHIIQGRIIKIGKAIEITSKIRIIGLTNKNIFKTMDFDKMTQGVFVAIRKDMSKRIFLYGRKFQKMKLRTPCQKVGINVAMVDWDQPVLDVFVTNEGQKARIQEEEKPQEREVVLQEDDEPNGREKSWFIKMQSGYYKGFKSLKTNCWRCIIK